MDSGAEERARDHILIGGPTGTRFIREPAPIVRGAGPRATWHAHAARRATLGGRELAARRVRWVGDYVAFVVAETVHQAADTAELIAVKYERCRR